MKNYIAVIDSGIGGLTVLKRLRIDFPKEDFLYYGDNDNAPYGNKNTSELKERLTEIYNNINAENLKGVVIACNTLSATFMEEFKVSKISTALTLPKLERKGDYLICTPKTALCSYVKKEFQGNVLPMPLLASEIELNPFNLGKVKLELDLKGIPSYAKRLVLGCTHYLYLEEKIQKITGLKTLNGLYNVSENLKTIIQKKVANPNKNQGNLLFLGNSSKLNEKVYFEVLKGV